MKITDAMRQVQLLAFDTAPIIYYIENNPAYASKVQAVVDLIDDNLLLAVASSLILTEVLVHPIRTGNQALLQQYDAILLQSNSFQIVSVNSGVARKGAELRAKYQLKTPDALHIASAIVSGADAFLTNDKDMQRVTEITVLILDELEL